MQTKVKTKIASQSVTTDTIADTKKIIDASQFGISKHKISRNALTVLETLHRHGYEAYLVGGCLRDLILGIKPKDFDISTNAKPEQIKEIFHRQCRLVGRRFRLAHIMFAREIIEIATFRSGHDNIVNDKISKKNQLGMLLRDNVYGIIEDDVVRRDFTVNSLYYDCVKNVIYDFYHGVDDIKQGRLTLIGDPYTRYKEDPVRILRAIRFMAKLDMYLDKASEKPIAESVELLSHIPGARLFDESLKLLQAGYGVKTYNLLRKYGVLEQLFPVLKPFLTSKQDSDTERLIITALTSTDERIKDKLPVNPAFIFAAFFWYPMCERADIYKHEGGLTHSNAQALAANEILSDLHKTIAIPKRHTGVIRDIWSLQSSLTKRFSEKQVERSFGNPKFRAGYDLLAMRADIEAGYLIDLVTWWHEYQLGTDQQRADLIKQQIKHKPRRNFKKTGKPKRYNHKPKKDKTPRP